MNNEQLILERLDELESRIAPICASVHSIKELKEDMSPLFNQGVQILIRELAAVESNFQLEDLFELIKTLLRNTRNISFTLKQLGSLLDFLFTIEPLLQSNISTLIQRLDQLELKGIFRIIKAVVGVRSKMAAAYSPEDIDKIGDGLVVLFGLVKKLGDPKARAFLDTMAALPSEINLSQTQPTGLIDLLTACRSSEVRQGLGVIVEFIRATAKVKSQQHAHECS